MAWWKNVLKAIPLIFAGYEVGKHEGSEGGNNNNEQLISYMRENTVVLQNKNEKENLDIFEIIMIVILALLVVAYIIRLMHALHRRQTRN